MQLQRQIASYLNGRIFPQKNSTLANLKKNIKKITGEEEFTSFSKSYSKVYSKKKITFSKKIRNVKSLKINVSDEFLKPLREFQEYVKKNFSEKELLGAYVHGSLGDGNYIQGYSDFDALFIVKKDILDDKKKIRDLKKKISKANTFLYLLDPLQHHGFFIITELDMQYYFEPAFPLELFKYSREVTDFRQPLNFRCLSENNELKKEFNDLKKRLRQKIYNGFTLSQRTSAHIKLFVQGVLLLPTIFLQLKNRKYIFKKESFFKAKKYFTQEEWEVVQRCSHVRKICKYKSIYPYWLRKFIGLNIHYKVLAIIHRYLDRNNFHEVENILGDNYLSQVENLLRKMEAIIK